jgi:DNA primase
VVVEGYTDVMACHLAGETTAIATCGTAFGEEHIKILRRLLADRNQYLGYEVVFTFDGDSAGQKAALRAFMEDQRWVTQTFVAVQPDGMDPCELRIARGDAAVSDLISARIPLFEFVIRSRLNEFNLETPEGRVRALRATAPIVASIHDPALRPEYGRRLAGWLGVDDDRIVAAEVRRAAPGRASSAAAPAPKTPTSGPRPEPSDSPARRQREALKIALQCPRLATPFFDELGEEEFTHAEYTAVRSAIAAAGGVAAAVEDPLRWLGEVTAVAADDSVRTLINRLAVEPPLVREPGKGRQAVDARYVLTILTQVRIDAVERHRTSLFSRLKRLDPNVHAQEYLAASTELNEVAKYLAGLRGRVDQ